MELLIEGAKARKTTGANTPRGGICYKAVNFLWEGGGGEGGGTYRREEEERTQGKKERLVCVSTEKGFDLSSN